jgi:hypothetical protein
VRKIFSIENKRHRPVAKESDSGTLRHVEKLLVAEHESAMADFVIANNHPSSSPQHAEAACEKAIIAMRRLGAFLKSRKIPEDLLEVLEHRKNKHRQQVGRPEATSTTGPRLSYWLT